MPVTYDVDKSDKRSSGQHMPSKPKNSNPSSKKDSLGDVTKKISNSAPERDRLNISGS
jgi:hypothetical protein